MSRRKRKSQPPIPTGEALDPRCSEREGPAALEGVFALAKVVIVLPGRSAPIVSVSRDRTDPAVRRLRFGDRSILSIRAGARLAVGPFGGHVRVQVEPTIAQAKAILRQSEIWRALQRG